MAVKKINVWYKGERREAIVITKRPKKTPVLQSKEKP